MERCCYRFAHRVAYRFCTGGTEGNEGNEEPDRSSRNYIQQALFGTDLNAKAQRREGARWSGRNFPPQRETNRKICLPRIRISKNNQACTQHVCDCSNLRGSSSRLHAASLLAGFKQNGEFRVRSQACAVQGNAKCEYLTPTPHLPGGASQKLALESSLSKKVLCAMEALKRTNDETHK